jgi:hypothetical protein
MDCPPMSDKLNIGNEMRQFDLKNRSFYDDLTDEERKKFSNYLMIRWGSSVEGSGDLQGFYLISCNERLNKHFFAVNRHPKLQWLMATSVSPGMGAHRHTWIAPKKRESADNKHRKKIAELYPTAKDDELDLLATINSKNDVQQLLKDMGNDS